VTLSGRRALVTGGASGIGRATAALLRRRGAEVALLDSRQDAVSATAAEIGACAGCVADVRDEVAIESALDEAGEALGGPPDLIVTAAGVYRIEALLETSSASWDEVLAINLRGTFLVARAAARRLAAAARPGAIVTLASTAAFGADAREPSGAYSASKAAVLSLTRQMAVEWAALGIRVNAVCPGVIDTPMLRVMDDPAAGRAYLESAVPLARLGRADEVAAAIVFLLSDDASYLTGAAIPVEGGALAL
jgi:NAD(P)-dependent dehydrogenase (short-subunit alcohol dehydrogenase family)